MYLAAEVDQVGVWVVDGEHHTVTGEDGREGGEDGKDDNDGHEDGEDGADEDEDDDSDGENDDPPPGVELDHDYGVVEVPGCPEAVLPLAVLREPRGEHLAICKD